MANIHDVNESLQVQPSVRNLPTLIALSQGENGRSLQFRMVGATIPSGSSASLSGTKPDGVVYSKAGTVDGNTVIFQEDVQLTAVAGAWDAKIHIVNNGNSVATALIRFIIDPDPVAAGAVPSDTQLEGIVAECKLYAEAARSNAYGSPLTASAAADMIDTSKVYVYTGSETGYTAGHWYYYNGTAWADGGVYNSIAIQTDTTLTLPDHAADAKATGDALATKADKIGNIALAERLYGGKYSAESEPYHFRQAPEMMGAKSETIVGGSLGWNQLVQNGNFADSTGWSKGGGVTSFSVANNTATLNIVSGATYNKYIGRSNMPIISGHKYLVSAVMASPSITQALIQRSSNGLINASGNKTISANDTMVAGVYAETITGTANFYFRFSDTATSADTTATIKKAQIIDLTQMFGTTIADYIYSLETATAGAGVAWVKRYIDLDTYHEYDAGSIQSVEGLVSHDVVGFNQFDKSTAIVGKYIKNDGTLANLATAFVTDYIQVLPNTAYYCNHIIGSASLAQSYAEYDFDKNFIRVGLAGTGGSVGSGGKEAILTTSDDAHYIRFIGAISVIDETNFNISDPSRNGQYEPYEKHSYPLDSDVVLRGVPKLVTDHIEFDGDKYYADGSVERRYNYKTSGFTRGSKDSSGKLYTVATLPESGLDSTSSTLCISNKFLSTGLSNCRANADNGIKSLSIYGSSVFVSGFVGSESELDALLPNLEIVYKKTTPTTETAQPFQSPMIVGATEEYVSDSVVPVGHESKYYEDVAKKVNGLPKDFSTLIAPTEVTFTATRNYSVGSYLIVKNQLYKVTSAISSGGTITPNSNVTATTIMAEILALT